MSYRGLVVGCGIGLVHRHGTECGRWCRPALILTWVAEEHHARRPRRQEALRPPGCGTVSNKKAKVEFV